MHWGVSLVSTLLLFLSSNGHEHQISPKSVFLVLVQYSFPQFKVFEEFLNTRTSLQQNQEDCSSFALQIDQCWLNFVILTCNYLWLESKQFSGSPSYFSPFYFLIHQSLKGAEDPCFQINFCISTLYLFSLDSAVKRVIKAINTFCNWLI